ncbi:MAG TPA: class II glutamine amidotransferase [Armatimonadota bacterium]
MMVQVGGTPDKGVLDEFRALAANGNVLPGNTCGHGDGWGFAALRSATLTLFTKSEKDGATDPAFSSAAALVETSGADIVIGHLRKASVGDLTPANAHPFTHGRFVFCHNGGIKESERIPIYGLAPTGETDSERFFLNIVGRIESGEVRTLREACEAATRYVHENHKYSSISFIITDGEETLAWRDYRDTLQPGEEKPNNWDVWPEYYTLYQSAKARAVCSQPLTQLAADWQLMPLRQIISLA